MRELTFLELCPEPTMRWNGVPLFSLDDGRKLLDYCDRHDVGVLGVEGFKIVGNKRIPDLDCIADFSALAMTDGEGFSSLSRISARNFLDSISNVDVFLEFVLVVTGKTGKGTDLFSVL